MACTWECEVCCETYKDYTSVQIDGSQVCVLCVRKMFTKALNFEHEYPPRWDSPIHPEQFSHIFNTDYIELYRKKEIEYKSPPTKRVYCQHTLVRHDDQRRAVTEPCGSFLGVRQRAIKSSGPNILITAKCCDCNNLTCMVCDESTADCASMFMHKCSGRSQSNEERTHAFAALKRGKDWQQCPNRNCRRPIELSEACNHMSCPCGTGFCFICGKEAEGDSDHWTRGGCPRYNQPGDADVEYDDSDEYEEDVNEINEDLDPVDDIRGLFTETEDSPAEHSTDQHPEAEHEVEPEYDGFPGRRPLMYDPFPLWGLNDLAPTIEHNEPTEGLSSEDADAVAIVLQADEDLLTTDDDGPADVLSLRELLTTDEMNYDQAMWAIRGSRLADGDEIGD